MLPFEFEAALFQFDAREPEFAPLPKLPPRITAQRCAAWLCPRSTPTLHGFDPSAEHLPHRGEQRQRGSMLVRRQHAAIAVGHEA